MKVDTITSNVEWLKPRDISDSPEGFAERFDSRRREKELSKLDTNPRSMINELEKQSRNQQPLPEATIVGKR